MKALTHDVFSFGLVLFVLSRTGNLSLESFLLTLWLTLAVNFIIDVLGHRRKDGIPVRTMVTHSIFTAPIWGCAIGVLSACMPYSVMNLPVDQNFVLLAATLGVGLAYSHLLLDALSEAGIFYFRRRMRLIGFRYNNPFVNFAFIFVGATLVFYALTEQLTR